MKYYSITYDYYDKRGHIRTKKIECGTLDRVKYHCENISKLEEHKPISTPIIYIMGEKNSYYNRLDFNKVLSGEYN